MKTGDDSDVLWSKTRQVAACGNVYDRVLNRCVRRLFAKCVFSSCAHAVKLLRNLRGSLSVALKRKIKRRGQAPSFDFWSRWQDFEPTFALASAKGDYTACRRANTSNCCAIWEVLHRWFQRKKGKSSKVLIFLSEKSPHTRSYG